MTRKPRAFESVLAQIERRIVDDGLTAGDRLPGERQLAEQLQVGRSSVREALRVLESLGVVSSQAGRGPDAGAVLTARPGSALTDLLRLHLGLASLELREVVDTRLMIERWAAARAAEAGRTPRRWPPRSPRWRRPPRPRSSWNTTPPSTAPSPRPRATG